MKGDKSGSKLKTPPKKKSKKRWRLLVPPHLVNRLRKYFAGEYSYYKDFKVLNQDIDEHPLSKYGFKELECMMIA